ncbi:hypothetical protein ACJRPK_16545 [Aquimarina sp. 2-A2]|uniref:LTXXQ motif family protein n=1 Tax=Aquimarina intermedia TaxID=350814 RepID=A0A5S5BXB8_9FLAO|nr:hypothetical protein [Aquimarina intermedia]TYP71677.1 hypothetical protein BD809_10887 [Aquimarina intermedia]
MKKISLILSILFAVQFGTAQKNSREKIKAYKIAFFTEQLQLSSDEATKFWPVYNKYDTQMHDLKRKERQIFRTFKSQSEQEQSETTAKELLNEYRETEQKQLSTKLAMITDLKKVISSHKILLLFRAEYEFHKKLMQRLRQKSKE